MRVPDSETSPVALSSGFVSPSEFLSPVSHVKHSTSTLSKTDSMVTSQAPSEYSRQIDTPPIEEPEFTRALTSIRQFLRQRSTYDVFPISSRIIILDTELLVKRSLTILTANGIVSAPLWDSRKSSFAGMLSVADYINVIQYYLQNPDAFKEVDNFRLSSLRDVERSIGAQPIETIYAEPLQELYSACVQMVESRARRIPLVDYDDQTARMVVISVLTQYRILKFAVINTHRSTLEALSIPIRQLGIGTWVEDGVQTARWDTPVVECIQTLVAKNISSIPIVSDSGKPS